MSTQDGPVEGEGQQGAAGSGAPLNPYDDAFPSAGADATPPVGEERADDAGPATPQDPYDDALSTSSREGSQAGADGEGPGPGPSVAFADQFPLTDDDPVKVGDMWLDARLTSTPAGTAFVAHEDRGDSVMLILLSEGAATDPAARSRFSGEINAMHIDTVVARGGQDQHEGRMGGRYRDEDDDPQLDSKAPLAPWVALAFDGSKRAVDEAQRILLAVDLSATAPMSHPSGPDYRLHWIDRTRHGTSRLWPLPWPGRRDRAGWITMLVSFLLMALIAALALLLAILVFQNQPLVDAPQPIPSPASDGSGSGSASPAPSPGTSGSASPVESPGNVPTYSETPSMTKPSGNQSGQGDPSPNPKL